MTDLLPDRYDARINEHVNLLELRPDRLKRIGPDVSVSREPISKPLVIEEELSETYIEILHRPDQQLVAILELLSRPPIKMSREGRTTC